MWDVLAYRSLVASHAPDDKCFVAIDFETADNGRDSACAVALVRVERGQIVQRLCRRIRPPRRNFIWSHIHGITWDDVAAEPVFETVWADCQGVLEGVDYLVAHNAPFDRSVVRACCKTAGLPEPAAPWRCTVQIARRIWGLRPTTLPEVCRHLGVPLAHHDPASDAHACAQIILAAGAAALR